MEKAPKIQCVNVTKAYREHTVLNQVDLECESGEIAGIIGRNGAGKTVLFKAICGLTAIDGGKILIDGEERRNGEVLQSVGIIIEEPAFLAHASGYKNLEYLYMIRNRNNREHLKQVLSQVGLDPDAKSPWRNIPWGCASGWRLRRQSWKIPTSSFWTSRLTDWTIMASRI